MARRTVAFAGAFFALVVGCAGDRTHAKSGAASPVRLLETLYDRAVLHHVPAVCSTRIYAKPGKVTAQLSKPLHDLGVAGSLRFLSGNEHLSAFQVLDVGEIRDVREVAICLRPDGMSVAIVGGWFAEKDVLAAITARIPDVADVQKTSIEGLPALRWNVPEQAIFIVRLTPTIVAMSPSRDAFAELVSDVDRTVAWASDDEDDVLIASTVEGEVAMFAAGRMEGDGVALRLHVAGPGMNKVMPGLLDERMILARRFDRSGLAYLGDHLRGIGILSNETGHTIETHVPLTDIASGLNHLAGASRAQMEKLGD